MASQSQGIQQLLQAEKRAAEKVADARKRKARRLKQAKEEAQMEVEQYRREREKEFQSKQQATGIFQRQAWSARICTTVEGPVSGPLRLRSCRQEGGRLE
ncbi:ATP6V1G2-DDX39B isoform 3 [Pongo abelii]|uniref:V-type proton ATPase subunit G n=1 Tax=Pongo abelii TaxID=9601 RepID=A0A2J8R4V9_PONAB|nr:ATP6V1G2-DDX39B isoform 1 [Pongo abelii]PNJ03568.1 ATP6V1G2-DDX39B isoform 3 [Pongo abelii]